VTGYLLKRLAAAVPVLLGVSVLVFAMLAFLPGDAVDAIVGSSGASLSAEQRTAIRDQLGLNQPLPVRYASFIGNALRGDLGRSISTRRPVTQEIQEQIGPTLQLTVASIGIAAVVGLTLGTLAALRHNTRWDAGVMALALGGVSIPNFWLGLLLLLVFSLGLGWLPSAGSEGVERLVMPAAALGYGAAAIVARLTRSSMLEVLGQDFMRTARAKGLGERAVVVRHGLKNALIPVITLLGLQAGVLIANAVVVETVFSRQGIGRLLVQGLSNRDFPLVQGIILVVAVIYVFLNLAVDVAYAWIDPRIRYS
jgi:peptide/nickel transport system permease protein